MIGFLYSIMTDKRQGPIAVPFRIILSAASFVYGAAIAVRRLCYAVHIFRRKRAPLTVISVGNLTLGGTGKTPFVIRLAKLIETKLRRSVCVVIRGYGWDEQAMLKRSLTDIPIMVGEDRERSCHKAIRLYGTGTAILDDGFQHWELARDLDIVLVDAGYPFGNGKLFPRGILREPAAALKRAAVIVMTKVDKTGVETASLRARLAAVNPGALILEARHRAAKLYDRHYRELGLPTLRGKQIVAVSSIGDPGYFAATLTGLGARIVEHIAFQDHHDYTAADAARVAGRCDLLAPDAIVTTEKDIVKLQRLALSFGRTPLYIMGIEMEIVGEEALIDRLRRVYSR